jgi:mycoredoxin
MENINEKIIIYGTEWCGDTRRARRVFSEENIDYVWIDIDRDSIAAAYVKSVNNGNRSVPTILFPDGSRMVEPSSYDLKQKLANFK